MKKIRALKEFRPTKGKKITAIAAIVIALIGSLVYTQTTTSASNNTYSFFKKKDYKNAQPDPEKADLELGLKFYSTKPGTVTSVKFLKSPNDSATSHNVSVWDPETKELLTTGKTEKETPMGWQEAKLLNPVKIKANKIYIASYHTTSYMSTTGYFGHTVTRGVLKAPVNAGVFSYGSSMPVDEYRSSNYWVDIVLNTKKVGTPIVKPPTTPTTIQPPDSTVVTSIVPPSSTSSTSTTVQTPTTQTPTTAAPPTTKAPVTTKAPGTTTAPTISTQPPTSNGRPDASNTGVPKGTVLKPSQSLTITTPNTVIDGLDVSGGITIKAPGVVIKNSRVTGGTFGIYVASGDATIYDTEILGSSETGIGFDNWKAYRVNIHSMKADGVKLGSNVVLQDSYIHDFTPAPGAHADGGQIQSGVKNVVIKNNYINLGGEANAAFMLAPDLGPNGSGPVTIENNFLGGGNFTVQIVDGNYGQYHQSGYTVRNNTFAKNYRYSPVTVNEPSSSFIAWEGNKLEDGSTVGK